MDRKYKLEDYEDVTPPLEESISFDDDELQSPDFVYNDLAFEAQADFTHKMLH